MVGEVEELGDKLVARMRANNKLTTCDFMSMN